MTGYNHAATGMLIGAGVAFPAAIPVAIASHFILDILPHYGIPQKQRDKSIFWRIFFTLDFFAAWTLGFFGLLHHQPAMFWAGLAACSPDFFWVGRVVKNRSFNLSRNETWFTRWHAGIQRYERSWGLWIELPVSIVLTCAVAWAGLS